MTGGLAAAVDIVVVAAGTSSRMGGTDKLLVPLAGRPLLAHTLDALAAARCARSIILVTALDRVDGLRETPWVRAHGGPVVAGGRRRQDSVVAGLAVAESDIVLVHDGARPLVEPALIDRVAEVAARDGAAVPGRPVVETLKRVMDGRIMETVDRQGLVATQTPQGARRTTLLAAYAAGQAVDVTDEAAALEAAGVPVTLVEGQADNIKVTTPDDIERATAWLSARAAPRVGQGHDSHPFGPGQGLALGGIRIDEAPALAGHSDGDAALHAIADALLSAAGLADLGRRFPAGEPATRGADSRDLLRAVVADLIEAGWRPASVDLLIRGARPRLGPVRIEAIRTAVAGLVGLSTSAVSVHASSGNFDGPEGAGRSIAASAIVQVIGR